MSDAAQLPAPVTMLDTAHIAVAHEIAMGIREVPDILADHKISVQEWAFMREDPHFQQLLTSKIAEWNGALNTPSRGRVKAAAMVEINLDEIQRIISDETIPAVQRIAAFQFLAKLGGMAEDKRDGAPGPGAGTFQVKIFLGNDRGPTIIEGEASPAPNSVLTVD